MSINSFARSQLFSIKIHKIIKIVKQTLKRVKLKSAKRPKCCALWAPASYLASWPYSTTALERRRSRRSPLASSGPSNETHFRRLWCASASKNKTTTRNFSKSSHDKYIKHHLNYHNSSFFFLLKVFQHFKTCAKKFLASSLTLSTK